MPRAYVGAGIGMGQGTVPQSPGATTIPNSGRSGSGMNNPTVIYIWAGALLVLLLFHVGGAAIPGA